MCSDSVQNLRVFFAIHLQAKAAIASHKYFFFVAGGLYGCSTFGSLVVPGTDSCPGLLKKWTTCI